MHPNKLECCGKVCDDHIHSLATGGTNHPTNIQFLCKTHNSKKGHRITADYRTASQLKKIFAAFQLQLFAEAA
jgi:5-methylcytosine-specific restriction endonuclease McrA